jgi:hypothetical protein
MPMTSLNLIREDDDRVLRIERGNGQPVLTHRIPPDARPHMHPIIAPDGKGVLTEDRPSHHPWQQGLYTGFNLVNGIGFWRNEQKDGSFAPRLEGTPELYGNTLRWSLVNPWRHPDGSPMLTERQGWTLTVADDHYVLDLDWALRADINIEIGQFMAGGLFLRMPYAKESGAYAVNSDGLENASAEKQRARWVAVSMPIEGRSDWAGMAIMDHPSNPAHPSTWRVDNEFGISPSRVIAGSWTIARGDTDKYRYRVFAFCGKPVRETIESAWRGFTAG